MNGPAARLVPVVLAGGAGTRLWPLSRAARPKQFIALTEETSPFQQTLLRVAADPRYAPPLIVTNADYRFLVAEQAQAAGVALGGIVLEPVGRNTAPAIAAAALIVAKADPEALLHVLPSDQLLEPDAAYRAALDTAEAAALAGGLVTFGIAPSEPATRFGYIETGPRLGCGAHRVTRFVEKPGIDAARAMLAEGGFLWNSGMFVFRARRLIEECERWAGPVLRAARAALISGRRDPDFLRLDPDAFAAAPDISIDYALFERTDAAMVVPAPIGWSDLGTWDAVWRTGQRDETGNMRRGPVYLNAVSSSLVVSESLPVIADGVEDLAILASEDALYVGRLAAAGEMGAIVRRLRASPLTSALTETHRTSHRPWGGYASILSGERFQVKRLFVHPGKRLSTQMHRHRAEHWVIVRGDAEVRIADAVRIMGENESAYIPPGAVHCLSNPSPDMLEVIEVQTGAYLGEDDVVRIEDPYRRG